MRRPDPALVLAMSVPFMAGCFSTLPAPLPEPTERPSQIRGVVREDGGEGERIEFETVEDVRWTDSEVTVIGTLAASEPGVPRGEIVERSFPLSTLSGVLVRRLDPAKTSGIIAGVFIAGTAVVAFLVTGKTKEGQPIPGLR